MGDVQPVSAIWDSRDAARELPEQVIKRGAVQGTQQALDLLAGLLAEFPREEPPVPRPVTDAPLPVLP